MKTLINQRIDTQIKAAMDKQPENDLAANLGETKIQVEQLENRLENSERQDRLNVLLIDGLRFDASKSIQETVIETLNEILGIALYPSDILQAHRFGPVGDDGLPKSARLRLRNIQLKKNLMKRKGGLRNTGIFFREHLTSTQNAIFYQARLARKNKILWNVWTSDGLVYGVETDGGEPYRITDYQKLFNANIEAHQQGGFKPNPKPKPTPDVAGSRNATFRQTAQPVDIFEKRARNSAPNEPQSKPSTASNTNTASNRNDKALTQSNDLRDAINASLPSKANLKERLLALANQSDDMSFDQVMSELKQLNTGSSVKTFGTSTPNTTNAAARNESFRPPRPPTQ